MGLSMSSPLSTISDDVLVSILFFLEPPDLVRVSSVCKRLNEIAQQKIVWTNTCVNHLISRGFPAPSEQIHNLSAWALRQRTLAAYALAQRWRNGITKPFQFFQHIGLSSSAVSELKILPSLDNGALRLLIVSKSIWMEVSVWDVALNGDRQATLRGRWSPRGALFGGLAVDDEFLSTGIIAISIYLDGHFYVKIINIKLDDTDNIFHVIHEFNSTTDIKPVELQGHIVALTDRTHETILWNWKQGSFATLHDTFLDESQTTRQYNLCHQVVFAHQSILVVRARSIHLFRYPKLTQHNEPGVDDSDGRLISLPVASFSFGWVDGIRAALCSNLGLNDEQLSTTDQASGLWSPLLLLVRRQNEDAWSDNSYKIELARFDPNPEFKSETEDVEDAPNHRDLLLPLNRDDPLNYPPVNCPYIFPPKFAYHIPARRGSVLCSKLAFGAFGTAVWIEPREKLGMGLVPESIEIMNGLGDIHGLSSAGYRWQDDDRIRRESCLKILSLPGPLAARGHSENIWADMDYGDNMISVGNFIVGQSTAAVERSEKGIQLVSSRTLIVDDQNDWTAFDYEEKTGKLVLGTTSGNVHVAFI